MTPEQYAAEVIGKLRAAYNSKNEAAADAAFKEADLLLSSSKITSARQKEFWSIVRAGIEKMPRMLLEKQDNSALIALMQAIQKAIAERENK